TTTKVADADYLQASQLLLPFESSTDEMIRTSARGFRAAYAGVVEADRRSLDMYRQLLNGEIGPGALAQQATDAEAMRTEGWKVLATAAVPLAAHALTEKTENGGNEPARLKISEAQRKQLLARLRRSFGPEIQRPLGRGAPRSWLAAGAAGFYQYLSNDRLRALDK